jgi:hypothetical protein
MAYKPSADLHCRCHRSKVHQMIKSRYKACLLLLFCYLFAACQVQKTVNDESVSHRTYYDSLNLESPEAAIETFVQAWQQHDYKTVYMILAPAAQQILQINRDTLLWFDGVTNEGQHVKAFLQARGESLLTMEHVYDMFHSFDLVLLTAAEHSALQIYLPGPVTILDTSDSATTPGQAALDVTTRVEGIDGVVTFRMVQSPRQKWRVFQVIWPDGDEGRVPWAISADMETTPIAQPVDIGYPRTYYDTLALDTPATAVDTFTQAFQREDFPTVFWILDRQAQQRWSTNFGLLRHEYLIATDNLSEILWNNEVGHNLRALEEAGVIEKDKAGFTFLEMRNMSGSRGASPYSPLAMEQIGDRSYLFDQVMLAAEGRYLIDLTRPLTIHETHIRRTADEVTARVTTTVEGIEDRLYSS